MEAYPPDYVQHNLPLVLLSGLGRLDNDNSASPARQETGARIVTHSPECTSEQVTRLLQALRSLDGTGYAWNASALPGPNASIRYRIKTVGRSYSFPPRKAAPLPQSPGAEASSVARNLELHSPLSPLSPGSPVFPDGVFTPLWIHKHQEQVPCLFLAAFQINANEASQDERLRGDINAIRNALTRSMFKTRFAVLLVSDRSILNAPDLEDRLGTIRRATHLDSKTGLFFMPPMASEAEIVTFVQDTMKILQPLCIDYYRDLTKHARRKKARGGPPPLSGTPVGGASQATTQSGWNVRYEFKQAIFAEFRQEMDVAERHYSAALEGLFSTEGGVLETTTNWSPRWNEARLLSDTTALRILRCQLWTGQTTGSVQSWLNYKLRMKDLIDRRGKGSGTYGWHAWEGRWSSIMSQLVQLAGIAALRTPTHGPPTVQTELQLFALPEKTAAVTDRLPPWYLLHHSGYWLRLCARSIRARWEKALAIPEEDRLSPGQSPASSVDNRWKTYDSYLVPDPHQELPSTGEGGYNHATELSIACVRATEEFEARRQIRMSEQIKLELAENLIGAGRRSDAMQLLIPLWEESSWRGDEWHIPFERLLRMLIDCAHHDSSSQSCSLIPALIWELLALAHNDAARTSFDLMNCLRTRTIEKAPSIQFSDKSKLCPFTVFFAFGACNSYVGDMQECQLTLTFNAHSTGVPTQLSSLSVKLGKRLIHIRHEPLEPAEVKDVTLRTLSPLVELDDGTLETRADLRFFPQTTKVLDFEVMMRDPHVCNVAEVVLCVETPKFDLKHTLTEESILPVSRWYILNHGEVRTVLLPHTDSKAVSILPKPPKLQVLLVHQRKQYFTDEHVRLTFELINEESETLTGTMVPQLVGHEDQSLELKWDSDTVSDVTEVVHELSASSSTTRDLLLHAPTEATTLPLTLNVQYTLASDPATTLSKTVTFDLAFVPAFEAKFTFAPRLHPEPWPSYFSEGMRDVSDGVKQSWSLGAQLSSLTGQQGVLIRKLDVVVHNVQGGASCATSNAPHEEEVPLEAGKGHTATFDLTVQKFSLDDRRPSYLDMSLVVTWSSGTAKEEAQTVIAVPRLTVPTSEPRVLCTMELDAGNDCHTLQYHLENPSLHFLTFALTMNASDEFGFSGPKHRALSLAPLSRHRVDYRLLLHNEEGEEGCWISPTLQVVDSYYNKNLHVNPGGPHVKLNAEKGIMVWVAKNKAVS